MHFPGIPELNKFAVFAVVFLGLLADVRALRSTFGSAFVPSGSFSPAEGDLFLLEHVLPPSVNGSGVLLSLRGYFLNRNDVQIQVWRAEDPALLNMRTLVQSYSFTPSYGQQIETHSLYKEDYPICVPLEEGDRIGLLFPNSSLNVGVRISAGSRTQVYNIPSVSTRFPAIGDSVTFDQLEFPYDFSMQIQVEVGGTAEDGGFTGANCTDFEEIVQNFLDMTTAVPTTTEPINLKGESGATGATGPIGPMGPNGIQGTKGEQGSTGPIGATGQTGLPGLPGLNGTGIQGEPGLKGDTGFMGPTGPMGSTGPSGPPGSSGLKGQKGEEGLFGIPGFNGATGATGAVGSHGATGSQGRDGATGPQGERGLIGATGLPGPPGTSQNNTLPKYAGSTSRNSDSILLREPVIILLLVWNSQLTLFLAAVYIRKCCRLCRNGSNRIGASDPDFTEAAQGSPDNTGHLVHSTPKRTRRK